MSKIRNRACGLWLFSHFSSLSFWPGRRPHLNLYPVSFAARNRLILIRLTANHAQAHPTPHPGMPSIPTTSQSVASFEHANATFHSRSPLLASSEGALLLMSSSFGALCGAVRNRNLLHKIGRASCRERV